MAAPVRLALVWHMHQPSYRDPATGRFRLPWTRLHATKDYLDMPAALAAHPGVHVTFSLTPILLEQLDAIAAGAADPGAYDDPHLAAARARADALDEETRRFILREFFHAQRERMIEPHPRYLELSRRAEGEAKGLAPLTVGEMRDLQVWFHLAWVDPVHRAEEPIRSLWEQGRGFSEEQKEALLAWGLELAGRAAPAYREAQARGQAELATVPYHHPILPLLIDTASPREVSSTIVLPEPRARALEDAVAQIRAARRSHETRFGKAPAGLWPSEGAVSQEALRAIAAEGFAWAASDEETLRRALEAAGDPRAVGAGLHLQAWRIHTDAGPLSMLFRDRRLSDLIGFTYGSWDPSRAARDFTARVLETAGTWRGEGPAVVPVILDGENCWESYDEDGGPFLDALYGALESSDEIEAVTVSEALAAAPPKANLFHVPVSSWIRADLSIWVGHAEKNRAWTLLHEAREAIRAAESRSADASRIAAARASLHAAEASDWFWWYGDDHPSAHAEVFDALFRAHVRSVYRSLEIAPPSRLGASLRDTVSRAAEAPYVRPRLDGRESDFYEWRDAVRVDPAVTSGSMHQTAGRVRELRYGIDEHSLFVRVTLEPGVGEGTLVVERTAAGIDAGERERGGARVPLSGLPRGMPKWFGPEQTRAGSGDDGAYARDQYVEARLPFARFGAAPGETLAWRLVLDVAGRREETVPRDGVFRVERPRADRRLTHWSAT
ncbi:MAG TPA: glycoside hydrolase family 57 protein [Candidatus Eisenbacteria bacterium]|nr:glycoside hydrolase family 57 protein [Candidatus Eisenbacteria bacterium]